MILRNVLGLISIILCSVFVQIDGRIIRRETQTQARSYAISNYNFAFQCITYKLFDCVRGGSRQCFNDKVNECLRLMQDPSKWYPKQDNEHWYERPWYWFPEEIFPPKKTAHPSQKPIEGNDKVDKVDQDKDDAEDQTPKYDDTSNSSSSSSSSSDSDSSSEEKIPTTTMPDEAGAEDNGAERDDADIEKEYHEEGEDENIKNEELIEAEQNSNDFKSDEESITDDPE